MLEVPSMFALFGLVLAEVPFIYVPLTLWKSFAEIFGCNNKSGKTDES